MDVHLQKLKAALPIEVTAAFFAVKQIVDGARKGPAGELIAVGENFAVMGVVLLSLVVLNAYILARAGSSWSLTAFSSILFIFWAINIDIIRWEDQINTLLSLDPSGADARMIVGIIAVILSVTATIFSIPSSTTSNRQVVNAPTNVEIQRDGN